MYTHVGMGTHEYTHCMDIQAYNKYTDGTNMLVYRSMHTHKHTSWNVSMVYTYVHVHM